MGPIGPTELIVILVIALLILGPKKLPEVGKSLGKGMREFKDSLSSASDSFGHDDDEPAPRRRRTPDPAQVTAGVSVSPVADPADPPQPVAVAVDPAPQRTEDA